MDGSGSAAARVAAGCLRTATAAVSVVGVAMDMAHAGVLPPLVLFTVQSNVLLAAVMAAGAVAAFRGRPGPPPWLKGGATLYILITGLVFNLILVHGPVVAPLPPTSPDRVLGLGSSDYMHVLAPILAAADFVLFDRHGGLRPRLALLWLLYPLAYTAFTTVRGIVLPDSHYPYFFLDVHWLGYGGLLRNTAVYGTVFALLGFGLVFADRLLARAGGAVQGATRRAKRRAKRRKSR